MRSIALVSFILTILYGCQINFSGNSHVENENKIACLILDSMIQERYRDKYKGVISRNIEKLLQSNKIEPCFLIKDICGVSYTNDSCFNSDLRNISIECECFDEVNDKLELFKQPTVKMKQ
jgi:hypothetical protein